MKTSKVIKCLSSLSDVELKEFEKFIVTGDSHRYEKLRKFIQYYRKVKDKASDKFLEKDNVWKQLFGKTPYNEKELGYIQSGLVSAFDEFIIQLEFYKSEFRSTYTHAVSSLDRGLELPFRSDVRRLNSILDKQLQESAAYYYDRFKYHTLVNRHFDQGKRRVSDDNLSNALKNLTIYYHITKLKYGCELINRSNVIASDFDRTEIENVLKEAQMVQLSKVPIVECYSEILNMLVRPEEESHFFSLLEILKKTSNKFPISELRDIYSYAQNYCIKKVNTGDLLFRDQLFDIYKQSIDTGAVLVDGVLSPWTYKNIAGVALQLGNFEWVRAFIEKYHLAIRSEYREGAYSYNLANLSFHQKDYRNALRLLQQVQFTDPYYYLDSKSIMMKIYYDQKDMAIYQLMESIRTYLYRNKKVSEYMKRSYRNLLKFVAILVKSKFDGYSLQDDFLLRVNRTSYLNNSKWLIEQARKLN